jgi:hypothetical protein
MRLIIRLNSDFCFCSILISTIACLFDFYLLLLQKNDKKELFFYSRYLPFIKNALSLHRNWEIAYRYVDIDNLK